MKAITVEESTNKDEAGGKATFEQVAQTQNGEQHSSWECSLESGKDPCSVLAKSFRQKASQGSPESTNT